MNMRRLTVVAIIVASSICTPWVDAKYTINNPTPWITSGKAQNNTWVNYSYITFINPSNYELNVQLTMPSDLRLDCSQASPALAASLSGTTGTGENAKSTYSFRLPAGYLKSMKTQPSSSDLHNRSAPPGLSSVQISDIPFFGEDIDYRPTIPATCLIRWKMGYDDNFHSGFKQQRHYYINPEKSTTPTSNNLKVYYRGHLVAQGRISFELYLGDSNHNLYIETNTAHVSNADNRCGHTEPSVVSTRLTTPDGGCFDIRKTNSWHCDTPAGDKNSMIGTTASLSQLYYYHTALDNSEAQKSCNKDHRNVVNHYFTLGSVYEINPIGIEAADADKSYVEVVNSTSSTLYWGFSDYYDYTANASNTASTPDGSGNFEVYSYKKPPASFLPFYFRQIDPGHSDNIATKSTDLYAIGIQAGPNLFTMYKPSGTESQLDSTKYYYNVTTANLPLMNYLSSNNNSNNDLPTVADPSAYPVAKNSFMAMPEFSDANGKPLKVCWSAGSSKKAITLINGAILMLTVYDPTSTKTPENCQAASPTVGFQQAGYGGL